MSTPVAADETKEIQNAGVVSNLDVEAQNADANASGGSTMQIAAIVFLMVVVAAVVVVVLVVPKDDNAVATSSNLVVTNYYLSSSVTLAGMTAAQFNAAVKTQFQATIATKMGVASNYVEVLTSTRRSVVVSFRVFASTPITQTKMNTLSTFLTDSSSNGFRTKLNTNLAAAGITTTISGVSGVVVQQPKAAMRIPPLVLIPTDSNSTSSSRRTSPPAGSSLATYKGYLETHVPGGVTNTVKQAKQILCYMEQASISDPQAWGPNKVTPEQSTPALLAAYDPAHCDGTQKNKTQEFMLYQPWHTGNPDAAGSWQIKAYVWVYTMDPKVSSATPMVSVECTFSLNNTASGTSMTTQLVSIDIAYDLNMDDPQESDGNGGYHKMTTTGCGKITATLKDGNFAGLHSYNRAFMTMKMGMNACGTMLNLE